MYLIVRRGIEESISGKVIAHISMYMDYKKALENCNLLNSRNTIKDRYVYDIMEVESLPQYKGIEVNNKSEIYIHFIVNCLENRITEFKEFIGYGVSDEATAFKDNLNLLNDYSEKTVGFAEIRLF